MEYQGITDIVCKVLNEITRKAAPTTTTQVSEDADTVAREWFSCIMDKMFSISNSNPVCIKVPSKKNSMRGGRHSLGNQQLARGNILAGSWFLLLEGL